MLQYVAASSAASNTHPLADFAVQPKLQTLQTVSIHQRLYTKRWCRRVTRLLSTPCKAFHKPCKGLSNDWKSGQMEGCGDGRDGVVG